MADKDLGTWVADWFNNDLEAKFNVTFLCANECAHPLPFTEKMCGICSHTS